nr:unnamed protein product [Callosobruchus analis]
MFEKTEWLCKNCDEKSDTSTNTVNKSCEEDLVKELAIIRCNVRLLTDLINELKSSNKLLLQNIEQLSFCNSDIQARQNIDPPIPYSYVVSKSMHNHSQPVLIITSKDENETNSDVMHTIKANVNPATQKSCTNDESLEKLKSAVEAKFSNKYRIATPKTFKLRLFISDVEKSLENRNDFSPE